VARFVGDKQAAFFDRRRRGPKSLVDESANERIERLLEEESPVEQGWLRSPASLELQAFGRGVVRGASHPHEPSSRAILTSRQTIRRALHRLGFGWRRPPPLPLVLAQDRDRFAREPAYLYLLREEFAEKGTRLKALSDRGDDSPEGQLTDGILDQLAKFERAKTAERTRRGRLRKAHEGKVIAGRRAPTGACTVGKLARAPPGTRTRQGTAPPVLHNTGSRGAGQPRSREASNGIL
jgi:hypothetical protein